MKKLWGLLVVVWVIHYNYLVDEFKNIVEPRQQRFETYAKAMKVFNHIKSDYKVTNLTIEEVNS